MDVDGNDTQIENINRFKIDYSDIKPSVLNVYILLIQNPKSDQDSEFEHRIKELGNEIERIAPHVRANAKQMNAINIQS